MIPKRISSFLFSIQSISLKWKLLIPFMFLAFIGTTTLLLVSFYYQKKNIEKQEIEKANDFYRIFCSKLKEREYTALALASLISHDPNIPRLVGERQKAALYEYAFPIYQVLRSEHGIYQLHFHSLGAWSLLRMNAPEIEGERIAYRKSVMEVQRLGIPKGGVEWGLTGLSVRGVAPLWSDSEIVGSLEVGFPLDESFLLGLKEVWKVDFAIFEVIGPNYFYPISSTSEFPLPKVPISEADLPLVRVSPPESPESLLLLGPLKGESDELVALVGIKVNRHKTIEELQRARKRTLLVASLGIILSCLMTYLVAAAFVKPIKEVVQEAHEIAAGKRESLLKERPFDEMGILTNALNRLLSILLIRKNELERYAKILEKRVLERTEDLIKSEEKYRTLVENLPIIVYRILKDGTVEFVNSYFTEKIGYTIEEIVKDKDFWWKTICNLDIKSHEEILKCCWDDGKELRKERKIKTKDGKELIFVDHIIPIKSNGNVKWIDGFMVDITELKMLQQKIIEAEELRALRDISQRFAHEIRNPITAAGGFARRLYLSLPADSPYKRLAEIILKEISRLEAILNILLATIEPIKLNEELVELLALLDACVEELDKDACIQNKKIALHKRVETLWLNGDRALLQEAFNSIIGHSLFHTPEGGAVDILVALGDSTARVVIRHPSEGVSKQDVGEFFLPRVSPQKCTLVHTLPRAKIIINRHGGKIGVRLIEREGALSSEIEGLKAPRELEIIVELPVVLEESL